VSAAQPARFIGLLEVQWLVDGYIDLPHRPLIWTTHWYNLVGKQTRLRLLGSRHAGICHRGKRQLTELVRRAEAGDEAVLTRHGHPAVRLVPVRAVVPDRKSRRALLEVARASGASKAKAGPDAARSQDFLYGDDGLPR